MRTLVTLSPSGLSLRVLLPHGTLQMRWLEPSGMAVSLPDSTPGKDLPAIIGVMIPRGDETRAGALRRLEEVAGRTLDFPGFLLHAMGRSRGR